MGEARARETRLTLARQKETMKESTHILIKLPSKGQEDLYRADGMLVASRTKEICRFGNDIGTAQSRLFLTEEKCALFLRRLADVDMVCQEDGVALHERVHLYAMISRVASDLRHKTETDLRELRQLDPPVLPPLHLVAAIEERDGESVLTLPGQHLQAGVH